MVYRRGGLGVGRVAAAIAAGFLAMTVAPRSAAAGGCTPIACGNTLSGALSAIGESDCFTTTLDAGETVSVTTQETAGFFQACWALSGPMGSFPAVCGQAQRTVPVAGTYTIQVFDNANDQT